MKDILEQLKAEIIKEHDAKLELRWHKPKNVSLLEWHNNDGYLKGLAYCIKRVRKSQEELVEK